MLINGSSVTVTYKRIDGIKKAYYNNDAILKGFFNEAMVLPVPDDAPVEIPRIIIKTLHEHAQLNISPIASTFEVHYNEGYERDWRLCSTYIRERMDKVLEFLNILTDNNYEYIGVVTNLIFDDISTDGAKKIADTLLKAEKISGIYDINIKYTFVKDNSIFTNIMLQNARIFKKGIVVDRAGELRMDNQTAESIGAIIDINDRYGFNNDPSYKSDSSKLDALLTTMSDNIDYKLFSLIEKGEY